MCLQQFWQKTGAFKGVDLTFTHLDTSVS